MEIRRKSFFHYRILYLFLILALIAACGSRGELAGNYRAEAKDSPTQTETILELKANGDGYWKSGGEEIPFTWYIKSGELRVHTKGGAVLVGDIEKDTIHLSLDESNKKIPFKKF
jgi:hypothetical protein